MKSSDITHIRLLNQQITTTDFTTPQEIVGYLGAVQAQDYPMAKWAIGVRLPNITDNTIEKAINNGEIIRTHILRPTWHFVSSDDIHWMLDLTAPHLKSIEKSTYRKLELTDVVLNQCNNIIAKALEGGQHLTRAELLSEIQKHNIITNEFRANQIMFQAELEGLVCNGAMRGKHFTYALLEEKVPKTKPLDRDEALAELTKRYFISHGPATIKDFVWWSGLNQRDTKIGLELNKYNLDAITIDNQIYWCSNAIDHSKKKTDTIHFLPAFDEFMVSYKDRSASLSPADFSNAITGNGIFKPIIVVNGKVIGIWKRSIKNDKVVVVPYYFNSGNAIDHKAIELAIKPFKLFLNLNTQE